MSEGQKEKKRNRFRRPVRIAAYFFGSIAILMLVGAAFEAMASTRDSKNYPAPGKFVEVKGHKMHIYCTGSESPTVVMDAGLGESSVSWSEIQSGVSNFTRVCSFDRMGMAWSDVG